MDGPQRVQRFYSNDAIARRPPPAIAGAAPIKAAGKASGTCAHDTVTATTTFSAEGGML
jgi:hypothetical protein